MSTKANREEQDRRFDRYNHLLGSLGALRNTLRAYNVQYWDNRLTDEQLDSLDTSSSHVQRVYDLEFFHVQFDSLEETVEMWWRVFVGEQPDSYRWGEFKFDPEHLCLIDSNVRQYEPGIHRVRIDLTAHWERGPVTGRRIESIRKGAKDMDETLAQLEVLSAYGLHTKLFREQDGVNLPYSDMAGTDVLVPGRPRSEVNVLYVAWYRLCRSAEMRPDRTGFDNNSNGWACPVLRES